MPLTKENNMHCQGVAISPGLAIGHAYIYRDILAHEPKASPTAHTDVDAEWTRINDAIDHVCQNLKKTATKIEKRINTDAARIFLAQEVMLQDPGLLQDVQDTLKKERGTAEQTIKQVFRDWETQFQKMVHKGVEQTGEDVNDLARRILMALQGIDAHELEALPSGNILVTRRLLPSETTLLSRESTKAVLLEQGGQVSHTAILLKGLGVPCVAQCADLLEHIEQHDTVFVDGNAGSIIVRPDAQHKEALHEQVKHHGSCTAQALGKSKEPATTRNGMKVTVMANVSCKEDVERAVANGADGVGLYRTEHLFLSRTSPPSEHKLLANLSKALAPLQGKPIVLRLLDAGGDKHLPYLHTEAGNNPFLGRRGIRILLEHKDLLLTQLRAFVRLSTDHDIRILVPMVTLVEDMQRTRECLHEAAAAEGITQLPPLGAMIETPAAALCVADISGQADFLSIGTNDLTQYTMAAGRENHTVDAYFVDDHPAVLRLIQIITTEAKGCPVSICGELAARPQALQRLLQYKISSLSVASPLIPSLKEAIRTC